MLLPRALKRCADESRKRMLLRAAVHVSMARVQREPSENQLLMCFAL